jgi:hypothetical protein
MGSISSFWLSTAKRQKMIVGGDQQVEMYLERAKEREAKAAEYESTSTKAKKVISNLEREEAAFRVQMLVP